MELRVRQAIESDLPDVVRVLQESSEYAGFTTGWSVLQFVWDDSIAERLFRLHLGMPNANVWVVTDEIFGLCGLLMVSAFQHPFGNFQVAKETMWYISDEARGSLRVSLEMLRLFEEWAKSIGCKYVSMASQSRYPSVGKLYTRLGYEAVETSYMKVL